MLPALMGAAKLAGDTLGAGGGPSSAQSGATVTGPTINLGGDAARASVSPWVIGAVALTAISLAALGVVALKQRSRKG